jgi:hypothetical protein
MSDLIVLKGKTKSSEEKLEETNKEMLEDYYQYMNEMSDDIEHVLSIVYTKGGQMLISSNGVDAKSALWMVEEFKLNCLMGTFDPYESDKD